MPRLFLGCPYGLFAGRDASRGLGTFSLREDVIRDGFDDLSDLTSKEMEKIREWEKQFQGLFFLCASESFCKLCKCSLTVLLSRHKSMFRDWMGMSDFLINRCIKFQTWSYFSNIRFLICLCKWKHWYKLACCGTFPLHFLFYCPFTEFFWNLSVSYWNKFNLKQVYKSLKYGQIKYSIMHSVILRKHSFL